MKPQLQDGRYRCADNVDVDSLRPEELRAYIAGLRERRQSLIDERCGAQCDQCMHQRSCGRHSITG